PSGNMVAAAVGNEEQVRRGTDPDAAKADFQSGDVGKPVVEDLARVEMAVAVGVFENEDAVVARSAVGLPVRIGQALGDPEPATIVKREADGLHHGALAGT